MARRQAAGVLPSGQQTSVLPVIAWNNGLVELGGGQQEGPSPSRRDFAEAQLDMDGDGSPETVARRRAGCRHRRHSEDLATFDQAVIVTTADGTSHCLALGEGLAVSSVRSAQRADGGNVAVLTRVGGDSAAIDLVALVDGELVLVDTSAGAVPLVWEHLVNGGDNATSGEVASVNAEALGTQFGEFVTTETGGEFQLDLSSSGCE